jgi:PhoH-like ATPase
MPTTKILRDVSILDTSILIHDPELVNNCHRKIIVTPFVTFVELDKKKNDGNGDVAASARHAIRNLERLLALGDPRKGILTPSGALLFVDHETFAPRGIPRLNPSINDDLIIGTALRWQHRKEAAARNNATGKFFSAVAQQCEIGEIVLLSKDVNLRVKARACGLKVEDYQKDRLVSSSSELYTGIVRIPMKEDKLNALEAAFYKGGSNGSRENLLQREQIESLVVLPPLLPNACCIFHGMRDVLALYCPPEREKGAPYFQLIPQPKIPNGGGKKIRPRNVGQSFAYTMLSNPNLSLVALSGIAGSGKTLMALAAGLEQVKPEKGKGWYNQIICVRPTQELGNPIGYLKGTLTDKMSPWARPIVDALQLISDGREHEAFETEGPKQFTLEDLLNDSAESPVKVEPSNFMQGRSLHHKILIVDEVQNFRPSDVKKLITRAGKGSKVILVGDVEQVESPYLDAVSNGLSYVIERMKGQETFGHITFWESERSPLAELAAKLL